jgi:hypothetical protein
MKHFLLFFGGFLLHFSLLAQDAPDDTFIRDHFTKREVMIPMRDGARLFTAIYTPKDQSTKYPVLITRTPYSCSPYGAEAFPGSFKNMDLARAGYIFVFQDVRGAYMSEGDFEDVRPFNPAAAVKPKAGTKVAVDESTDTYDTVDWLLKNANGNNGNVGVVGTSYPGFYATIAILAGHPAIKAVSPQAPVTDWFVGDDFHHNGAFMLMDAFSFYSGFGKPRPKPTMGNSAGFSDWKTPDNYDFYLRAGALRNYSEKYGMKNIPFWNDLMGHPDYDAWWKARTPRPYLKNIRPAVLTVGGLFDAEDCWGAWNTYKSIENQNVATHSNRIVMGPWVHGGWHRTTGDHLGNVRFGAQTSAWFQHEIELKFFEYYLKGAGTMDLPEANVFETGSNKWASYNSWPPKEAIPEKWYFQGNGALDVQAPAAGVEPILRTYTSDPAHPVPYTEDVHLNRTREYMTDDQRFAARRPDVLVYQTAPLDKPVTVAGPVTADIWISLDDDGLAPKDVLLDADLVVKIIDVFPDTLQTKSNNVPLGGYQMLVRGEIFRGRYRNSFEQPEGFDRGDPTHVRFELPDIAHTFLPGHKMMVQVQSSWFPLADRNPQQFINIYQARDTDFIPLKVTVHQDASMPSGVVFSVMK